MTPGKRTAAWLLLSALAVGCSSGSSGSSDSARLQTVLQDLTLDPDGRTTVLTFDASPGAVGPGQVQASGGQSAQTVARAGRTLTVTWDARVTPAHQVRVTRDGVQRNWRTVATSDASQPTFVVSAATQDTSDNLLGGDTLQLTFAGPRVVEADAEDPTRWQLEVGGAVLDLTGSVLDLDPATQVLDVTLGPGANLHAAFTVAAAGLTSVADVALDASPVAGAAGGDAQAPSLLSVEQRLDLDGFGRLVEFVFDEPMDPVFSPLPAHFALVDHPEADGVTLVTGVAQQADPRVLHVTFSRPVAPGYDQITHSGLVDAHGNLLPANTEAFTSTDAPNAFAVVTATTAAGTGGDTVVVVTDQAFDPDFATDPARWSIDVAGVPLVMADQGLVYDYLTKTLTVTLDLDMRNGDAVDVDAVGQVDVDGQDFSVTAATVAASGDSAAPVVRQVLQNRTVDALGYTVDVHFSEDLHPTQAQDVSNYTFTPAANVTSATLGAGGDTVRLVVDDRVLVPGDVTLTVDGDVDDLAGNVSGAPSGPHAIASRDSAPPAAVSVAGEALEGADDDLILVAFDDDMLEAEVEDPANWSVESPVGTPLDVSASSIDYDVATRRAGITLDAGGQALQQGDEVGVALANMRDVAGNVVDGAAVTGAIAFEQRRPTLHTVWRANPPTDDTLELRFSEPCGQLEDLYDAGANPFGTRYALRDAGGLLRGYPAFATTLDGGLGVSLAFGFQIAPTDTLDVIGVSDLAGNVMFPALDTALVLEDASVPQQGAAPLVLAVAGEDNDSVTVQFNVDMSPWRISDPTNYTVQTNPGGVAVELSAADVQWDGRDTVTLTLGAGTDENLQAAESYDVTVEVDAQNPLRSSRGVPIAAPDTGTVAVGGDVGTGPTQAASLALLDTTDATRLVVVFDEAVDQAAAEVPASYDYDGGNLATDAQLVSPRVVRLTFGVPVAAGRPLVVDQGSAVDLAGNAAAGNLALVTAADSNGPLLGTVSGSIREGEGGDHVVVTFSEQLDLPAALDPANYTVGNGPGVVLPAASLTWDSVSTAVTIALPDGVELDATQPLAVQVGGVRDAAGNPMPAPVTLGGPISGDAQAPALVSAWANRREAADGTLLEVLFSEDVDMAFAGDAANWSTTGAAAVDAVTVVALDHVRLTLDSALADGDALNLLGGLEDLARNAAAALSIQPVDPND